MTVHLIKLAVGIESLQHLKERQAWRIKNDPPLRHQTRSTPKRAAEIEGKGSIYWVIRGHIAARQIVKRIEPAQWEDGSPCCALILDRKLVPVLPRAVKAFQGWRYLEAADAPPDATSGAEVRAAAKARAAEAALPARLRKDLRELGLI
ncbi:MAG: DUF1489 domain-containing protein [Alphaproteobacteria bacterium]|nr:DUF1489 domain-containing protein [Alphaproteobacteria bacterium]